MLHFVYQARHVYTVVAAELHILVLMPANPEFLSIGSTTPTLATYLSSEVALVDLIMLVLSCVKKRQDVVKISAERIDVSRGTPSRALRIHGKVSFEH